MVSQPGSAAFPAAAAGQAVSTAGHIELLGVRGAGKSTLFRLLESRDAARGGKLVSSRYAIAQAALDFAALPLDRIIARCLLRLGWPERAASRARDGWVSSEIARFARRYPECVQSVVQTLAELPPGRTDDVSEWMFRLFANYMAALRGSCGRMVVFDEGFSLRSLTLFGFDDGIAHNRLDEYLHSIPAPAILWVVRVPSAVAEARSAAARRAKGRPTDDPRTWAVRFRNGSEIIDRAVDVLTRRGTVVIELDGMLSPGALYRAATASTAPPRG